MGLIIVSPHLSDAGAITGAATAGNMTVANLLRPQPTDTCRFASLGSMYVEVDLGSPQEVDTIWSGYTNGSSAATKRVRGATSQANLTNGSAGYDATTTLWPAATLNTRLWTRVHGLRWLGASPQTFRWWRLDFSDAANPAGYFEWGRLYIAKAWQPPLNCRYGARFYPVETPRIKESEGGQRIPKRRPRRQAVEFTLRTRTKLPADAWANAYEIDALRGLSDDVLFIYDPTATDYLMHQTVYGLMTDLGGVTLESYAYYGHSYRIEELP